MTFPKGRTHFRQVSYCKNMSFIIAVMFPHDGIQVRSQRRPCCIIRLGEVFVHSHARWMVPCFSFGFVHVLLSHGVGTTLTLRRGYVAFYLSEHVNHTLEAVSSLVLIINGFLFRLTTKELQL